VRVVGGAGEAVSLFGVVFKFEEKQQQASVSGRSSNGFADDSQPEGATFTVFLKRRMPAGVYFESSSKPDLYSGVEVKIVMTLCTLLNNSLSGRPLHCTVQREGGPEG